MHCFGLSAMYICLVAIKEPVKYFIGYKICDVYL